MLSDTVGIWLGREPSTWQPSKIAVGKQRRLIVTGPERADWTCQGNGNGQGQAVWSEADMAITTGIQDSWGFAFSGCNLVLGMQIQAAYFIIVSEHLELFRLQTVL